MPFLIDTDVGIHLRDGDRAVSSEIRAPVSKPFLSIISRVELENGGDRLQVETTLGRTALDALIAVTQTLPFDDAEFAAYRAILDVAGSSRPKINDRMIATTALAND